MLQAPAAHRSTDPTQALLSAQAELRLLRLALQDSLAREARAQRALLRDALTGLPNRQALQVRSEAALPLHARQDWRLGVLFIDLDQFKAVNDTHGHAVGDGLLRLIGHRLARAVRLGDTVCRQGGDEFVCLIEQVPSAEHLLGIARQLHAVVAAPCQVDGLTLSVHASIGVAVYPQDGQTLPALVERADQAMYRAKQHRLGLTRAHAVCDVVPTDACNAPTVPV